jgi:hypothetical protein
LEKRVLCVNGSWKGTSDDFGGFSLFSVDSDIRSAGFPTCRAADFQIGGSFNVVMGAGLEARDAADLEVCATPAVDLV